MYNVWWVFIYSPLDKYLRMKISKKSLTQRFDDATKSLSSDKIKLKLIYTGLLCFSQTCEFWSSKGNKTLF